MTPEPNDLSAESSGAEPRVDRRGFLQGMGAAGILGAVGTAGFGGVRGVGPREVEATVSPAFAARQVPPAANDFPRPAGLRAGAQLDCRWPVTYEQTIPRSVELVTRYFAAWSSQDLDGLASVLHFPFAIFEQTDPIVFENARSFLDNPPMTLAPANRPVNHPGHYTGRIAPGSYNLLESIDVPLFCPIGAVVALTFSRYSESGHKLLECDGIFTVTNNDGRWGIELVSTILTPTHHIGVPQPDAEMAALRVDQDSMLRYTNRHLPAPEPSGEDRFFGKRAGINFGYGPRDRTNDARNDRPMEGWRTAGVTSRLTLSELSADSPAPPPGTPDPNYPMFNVGYNFQQFADLAGGNVGQWGDTFTLPYQPRILGNGRHVNMHKAHSMGGYIRHTPDLTMIAETRVVNVRVYRGGRWGGAGSIGQVTYHDRSNSYDLG